MGTRLIRPALREVRSRVLDSARWAGYKPRADDIIIATYPKCGTTWMQRIVGMLVLKSVVPFPIQQASPWPDLRVSGPIEEVFARAEAQTHRRFLKSHLPYDALPVYEGAKFIHVARDGRDAAMSFHNTMASYTPIALARYDKVSLADPKFGTPFPRAPNDPAEFFHDWVSDDGGRGDPAESFFPIENSYWAARCDANMLLVHYNDLKDDRAGEIRRVAAFLGIDVAPSLWPALVEAAGFEAMKAQSGDLVPHLADTFEGGSDRFLHKGTNGRWQDVVAKDDLARYDAKVKQAFSPALARWIEHGRLVAGDPREAAP